MVLVMNIVINECVALAKKLPLSAATGSRSNRYKNAKKTSNKNTSEGGWASNSGPATRDKGTEELKGGDGPI